MSPNQKGSDSAIGIAGAGRLAQAFGRLLLQKGWPVTCFAARDLHKARRAAEFAGPAVEAVELSGLMQRTQKVLIAVSDDGLAETASILAQTEVLDAIALHTCGAKDLEDMEPLRSNGVACGSIHPLQSIASASQGLQALPGATFAVSGDHAALEWSREIAAALEGHSVDIAPGKRALYHAAASMASNYSVSLIDAAAELMAMATSRDRKEALNMIAPIVRTSVNNALQSGAAAALTGPIERGDARTVAMHVTAFSGAPDRIRRLYHAAGLQTLDLARRKGLPEENAIQVEAVLLGITGA